MATVGPTRPVFKSDSEEYDQLMPDEGVGYDTRVQSDPRQGVMQSIRRWKTMGLLSICFNLITFVAIIALARERKAKLNTRELFYSPANEAIEYVPHLFHPAITNSKPTEYQGEPSPELDQKWDDLYSYGMTAISKEEADRLPNKTDPMLVGDKAQYVIQLDVFHQLHCVNMLRMTLWPEYYKDMHPDYMEKNHLSHCIDSLRQAIQCNADVTPFVWRWHEEKQSMMGHLNMLHTCRNFEKIREWARPKQLVGSMNFTYHVHE